MSGRGGSATHRCRGCGSSRVSPVLDLGRQAASDFFPPVDAPGPDPRWPLELWFCLDCTLVQLGPVQPPLPEIPLAVESATSLANAARSVRDILAERPELAGGTVAEFASHHGGSWLPDLTAAGVRPAPDGAPAELVVDVHGLVHEPNLADAFAERVSRLAPGGTLVLEFHHLLPLLRENQYDTVRHGHWSYLSLGSLSRLAGVHGLVVASARAVPLFGGCLRVALRYPEQARVDPSVAAVLDAERDAGLADPTRVATLGGSAREAALALHDRLAALAAQGRRVLGYGAPSKAAVLLDLSGIGPELLPFVVDAAPGKHGRRIPGAGVPIRPVRALRAARPDVVLILVWDLAEEVVDQLESGGGWGAEYLVPSGAPAVSCS